MDFQIGAYYFPGWYIGEPGVSWRPNPWASNDATNNIYVGAFPERRPQRGYFNEAFQGTMDQQIRDAAAYGLSFFAFDWYWSESTVGGRNSYHQDALNRFITSNQSWRMKFCVMLANHGRNGATDKLSQWQAASHFWIQRYFRHPQYLKIDGKPVVIIFNVDEYLMKPAIAIMNHAGVRYTGAWVTAKSYVVDDVIRDDANALGGGVARVYRCTANHTSSAGLASDSANWTLLSPANTNANYEVAMAAMLNDARTRAQSAGHAGIYFVGCTPSSPFWVGANRRLENGGFDAVTMYNYSQGYRGAWDYAASTATLDAPSESYEDWDLAIRSHWERYLQAAPTKPYWVAMMGGWDRRPWRDAANRYPTLNTAAARTDGLRSPTVEQYRAHLLAAKAHMEASPTACPGIGVIYAWNEIGEGGYILPSAKYGFKLLEATRDVFALTPSTGPKSVRLRTLSARLRQA